MSKHSEFPDDPRLPSAPLTEDDQRIWVGVRLSCPYANLEQDRIESYMMYSLEQTRLIMAPHQPRGYPRGLVHGIMRGHEAMFGFPFFP